MLCLYNAAYKLFSVVNIQLGYPTDIIFYIEDYFSLFNIFFCSFLCRNEVSWGSSFPFVMVIAVIFAQLMNLRPHHNQVST